MALEKAALGGAAAADLAVSFDGRDATLIGSVATEAARDSAAAAVEDLWGVRRVSNELVLGGRGGGSGETSAETPVDSNLDPGEAGQLGFDSQDGSLVLRGTVPDLARRDGLLAHARSLWGEERVASEMAIQETMDTACWPESFEGFLAALKNQRQDLQVTLKMCRMELAGSALSELQRERLRGALAAALPGFELTDSMTLREATSAAEKVQVDLDAYLAAEIVEFATNSAELTPAGKAILDRVAEILQDSDASFEISGHTDSQGEEAYNLDLSARRAKEARRYLIEEGGIEADRLLTAGYGETRPVADNATPEGRQKNRRTEFRALAPGQIQAQ